MIKYLAKLVLDILPSVVATIIGAYIVNHYIVARPDAPAAAVAAAAVPAKAEAAKAETTKAETAKAETKPGEAVQASAAADKAGTDNDAADKTEQPAEKTSDKSVDKNKHRPAPHERAVAKATAPVTTGSVPAESAVTDERRDANELARAAIERLRQSSAARPAETPARIQEAARVEAPRGIEAPRAVAPMQPLPPAVSVAMPAPAAVGPYNRGVDAAMAQAPPYTYSTNGRGDTLRRPSPPAEIPLPVELPADEVAPSRPTVAEDVLLAARSVFRAVLPR